MNRKRTLQGELERVTKQIDKLIKAIIDGLMDEIFFVQLKLRSRLGDLLCSFSNEPPRRVRLSTARVEPLSAQAPELGPGIAKWPTYGPLPAEFPSCFSLG